MKTIASWCGVTTRKLASWFTARRRQLIQGFFVTLAPVLIGLGLATADQTQQWLILSAAGLQFGASLLNLINLRGALTIWTAARGAIYTAAASAAPALTVLGYWDQSTSATALAGLSLGLSSLSSLLAIFVSKDQEAEAEFEGVQTALGDVAMTRAEYRAHVATQAEG